MTLESISVQFCYRAVRLKKVFQAYINIKQIYNLRILINGVATAINLLEKKETYFLDILNQSMKMWRKMRCHEEMLHMEYTYLLGRSSIEM